MAWWSIANTLTAPFRSALNVALDRLSNNYAQTSLPDDSTVRPGMLVYLTNTNQLSLRNADDDDYLNVRLIFVSDDEPTIIHPFMLWHDTTNDLLKQVRADGTTWETIASWDGINFLPYRNGYVITELATAPVTLDATAEPTVDDDSELDTNPDGPPTHTVLSIWKNASLTAGKIWWLCRDNSIGAAVWDWLLPVASDDEKAKHRVLYANGEYSSAPFRKIAEFDLSGSDYNDDPLDDETLKLADAKIIKIELRGIRAAVANNRNIRMQLFVGGFIVNGGSDYTWSLQALGGGYLNNISQDTIRTTQDYVAGPSVGSKYGVNGDIYIFNGTDVSISWILSYVASGGTARQETGSAAYLGGNGPVDGVRFLTYNDGTFVANGLTNTGRIIIKGYFDDDA